MTKQELRKQYGNKRNQLPLSDRLRMDDLMLLQFQQFNYAGIQALLTYWPMDNRSEPNSNLCTGYLRHILPALTLAYPIMHASSLQITALAVEEDTLYQTNQWGVTEPSEGKVVLPEKLDLIFVPMLAFDLSGYRVGYGKGYYDRYLATCRDDVLKIGFSYFEPVEKISDTDQFDIPLTYCITPQKTYEF